MKYNQNAKTFIGRMISSRTIMNFVPNDKSNNLVLAYLASHIVDCPKIREKVYRESELVDLIDWLSVSNSEHEEFINLEMIDSTHVACTKINISLYARLKQRTMISYVNRLSRASIFDVLKLDSNIDEIPPAKLEKFFDDLKVADSGFHDYLKHLHKSVVDSGGGSIRRVNADTLQSMGAVL